MPINAHPEYLAAEKEYLAAQTTEQKIIKLKKMLAVAPKHKGAENLLKQLKTRLRKLKYSKEKEIKQSKHKGEGIRKDDMQGAIIGLTNSGKSSLLKELTNAKPKISNIQFSTVESAVGMMSYKGTSIQLIEIPAIDSEYYDRGVANTADTLIILITNLKDLEKITPNLNKALGKRIIAFNKADLLSENEKRKLKATLASKKHNFVLISMKTKEGLEELKEKIFQSFEKIRVYTKEPGKEPSNRPIVMDPDSTLKDIAEKILKGFSKKVIETKIWGPSSKFPGQKIGLKHKLKDMDIVEFKTK